MTKQEAPAPDPMDAKAKTVSGRVMDGFKRPIRPHVSSSEKPSERLSDTPIKPLMSKPRQVIDFAPVRHSEPVRPLKSQSTTTKISISTEKTVPVQSVPHNATPRKRLFIGDIKPIRKASPEVKKTAITEEIAPITEMETADNTEDTTISDLIPDTDVVTEVKPVVAKPRHRGIRIDFMKKFRSEESKEVVEEPKETEETTEPEEKPEPIRVSRVKTVQSQTQMEIPAPEEELADPTEEELAAVLAGFTDDPTESSTKPESLPDDEISDYEEELAALEEYDEISDSILNDDQKSAVDDFVSEPKPLFGVSAADPLVEQSIHRKKPEIKKPTTYIDGSLIREDEEPAKPAVEPYRQILGGRSPFLNSVSVEKRPLSDHLPEQKQSVPDKLSYREKLRKNIHNRDNSVATPFNSGGKTSSSVFHTNQSASRSVVSVPENKKSHSKLSIAVIVLITLILGAITGALIYLAFLQ